MKDKSNREVSKPLMLPSMRGRGLKPSNEYGAVLVRDVGDLLFWIAVKIPCVPWVGMILSSVDSVDTEVIIEEPLIWDVKKERWELRVNDVNIRAYLEVPEDQDQPTESDLEKAVDKAQTASLDAGWEAIEE